MLLAAETVAGSGKRGKNGSSVTLNTDLEFAWDTESGLKQFGNLDGKTGAGISSHRKKIAIVLCVLAEQEMGTEGNCEKEGRSSEQPRFLLALV